MDVVGQSQIILNLGSNLQYKRVLGTLLGLSFQCQLLPYLTFLLDDHHSREASGR